MTEDSLRELMEEAPGGENHGRKTSGSLPTDESWTRRQRSTPLGSLGQVQEAIADGFTITDPYHPEESGMVAHRGELTGEEYIDQDAFQRELEDELGYTLAEVQAVYKVGGKLTPTQREFRTYIDARMLALSLSGGNMRLMAEALDLSEKTIDRALTRARELYIEPQPFAGVVSRPRPCFICEEKDTTKPRKRRHEGCPHHLMPLPQYRDGTIDLCAEHYSQGFDPKQGSAAYWEFRRMRFAR